MKKKPYAIKSKEFGRGKAEVERFATLRAASLYIQGRWQGIEYRDGNQSFHNDYCTFQLVGFAFSDIGKVKFEDPNDIYSRYFVFDKLPIDLTNQTRSVQDETEGLRDFEKSLDSLNE